MKHYMTAFAFVLATLLLSCAPATTTRIEYVVVTETPALYVPAAQPASSNVSGCYSWQAAPAHIGQTTCIYGNVVRVYDAGSAFFIDFSYGTEDFSLVDFHYKWNNLKGRCVVAQGLIEAYNGRAEIIIRSPSQISPCP